MFQKSHIALVFFHFFCIFVLFHLCFFFLKVLWFDHGSARFVCWLVFTWPVTAVGMLSFFVWTLFVCVFRYCYGALNKKQN